MTDKLADGALIFYDSMWLLPLFGRGFYFRRYFWEDIPLQAANDSTAVWHAQIGHSDL